MSYIVLNRFRDLFHDRTGSAEIYGDTDGTLSGTLGRDDTIFGFRGDDTIYGDAYLIDGAERAGGNDMLFGGRNNDVLIGDADTLSNGARGGNDVLFQGPANPWIGGTSPMDTTGSSSRESTPQTSRSTSSGRPRSLPSTAAAR